MNRVQFGVLTVLAAAALFGAGVAHAAVVLAPENFATFRSTLAQARADAYVGRPGLRVESPTAFEAMRRHLLNLYGEVRPKRTVEAAGQVVDCIDVTDQPGVRLGRISHIAAPPPFKPSEVMGKAGPFQPTRMSRQDVSGSPSREPACSAGTIPMRRLTLEELARFRTLEDFLSKDGAAPATYQHDYAFGFQRVANHGGYGRLNLWQPAVNTGLDQIFSLSQQWYVAGAGKKTQTAETGWIAYPGKFGTSNPVLFIFWTPNNYKSGCYNLDCAAFVQVDSTYCLGCEFLGYSSPGGEQWEVHLGYYLFEGNWWMESNDLWMGYYPGTLYGSGKMRQGAELIEFGGETVGSKSWPPMGSGHFPKTGYGHAAYDRRMLYMDTADSYLDVALTINQPEPKCYKASSPDYEGDDWRETFYIGGPGGTKC